jgi:hypothetical protein
VAWWLGHETRGERDYRDADGDVDEEHPAPRRGRDEDAPRTRPRTLLKSRV